MRLLGVTLLAVLLAALSLFAEAHPGGKNAEGCHNNRKTGDYHCHGKTRKFVPLDARPVCPIDQGEKCSGCGCKGGPGYRSNETGKCVSYKQLRSTCGTPLTTKCKFENEPNSEKNRECITGYNTE